MLTNAPPTPRRCLALCQANSRFSVNACWEEGRERAKKGGGRDGRKEEGEEGRGEKDGERRKEEFTVVRVS